MSVSHRPGQKIILNLNPEHDELNEPISIPSDSHIFSAGGIFLEKNIKKSSQNPLKTPKIDFIFKTVLHTINR